MCQDSSHLKGIFNGWDINNMPFSSKKKYCWICNPVRMGCSCRVPPRDPNWSKSRISGLVVSTISWKQEGGKVQIWPWVLSVKGLHVFHVIELYFFPTKWAIYCPSMELIKRVIRLVKIIQQKGNITAFLSLIYIHTIKLISQHWKLLCHRDFLSALTVCYSWVRCRLSKLSMIKEHWCCGYRQDSPVSVVCN